MMMPHSDFLACVRRLSCRAAVLGFTVFCFTGCSAKMKSGTGLDEGPRSEQDSLVKTVKRSGQVFREALNEDSQKQIDEDVRDSHANGGVFESAQGALDELVVDRSAATPSALDSLSCNEGASEAEKLPFRPLRLTNDQLRSSLHRLLGPSFSASIELAAEKLVDDSVLNGYAVHLRSTSAQRFGGLVQFAKVLASDLTGTEARFDDLANAVGAGCNPSLNERWGGCAGQVVNELSRRLLRTKDFAASHAQVFAQAVDAGATPAQAWAGVLAGILMSSELHNVVEESGAGQLSARSVGTRLALVVSGALPDVDLLTAIENGSILQAEVRRTHALRLLASDGARKGFENFVKEWFNIPTNAIARMGQPGVTEALSEEDYRAAVARDLGAAASRPVFEGSGTFLDMMTSPVALADVEPLALAYGVPVSSEPVVLEEPGRASLLARVGYLSSKNGGRNLPHRGAFLMERLLCTPLGTPPPTALADAASVDTEGLPSRQAWDLATSAPNCINCHQYINPFGAGLDAYDGWGRFEASQVLTLSDGSTRVFPWDTSIDVTIGSGEKIVAQDSPTLAHALGVSKTAQMCFAVNLIDHHFAIQNKSNCYLKETLSAATKEGQLNVKQFLVELVASPRFVMR